MIQRKAASETCYLSSAVMNAIAVAHVLFSAILSATPIFFANSSSLVAQEIGNADAGREYAALHCVTCHAIDGSDMLSPNPKAPPFPEIARTPGMNGRAITVWLSSVHKDMPDLIIEKNDMEDVVAYIVSLAPAK